MVTAKTPTHTKTPFFTLPAIIQVGALSVRVKDRQLDAGELGRFDGGELLISIDVKQHPSYQQLMVTLLHEIGHFICYVYSTKMSEADVDRVAQGYAQAFPYIAEAQE